MAEFLPDPNQHPVNDIAGVLSPATLGEIDRELIVTASELDKSPLCPKAIAMAALPRKPDMAYTLDSSATMVGMALTVCPAHSHSNFPDFKS